MDMGGWKQEEAWAEEQDGIYLNGVLNERAWQINQKLNSWFGQTENRHELENGGDL